MYRPLLENKVTMSELNSCLTCDDLFEINALLDMQNDIKLHNQEIENAKYRNKR